MNSSVVSILTHKFNQPFILYYQVHKIKNDIAVATHAILSITNYIKFRCSTYEMRLIVGITDNKM
jgi:uncharacterized membrane protein